MKLTAESIPSEITTNRIAKAIAAYERTRMIGSPHDRWKNGDESAVSEQVKLGDRLFFAKAGCNPCHLEEVDALVAMMEALSGEGYMDRAPASFPR